MRDLIAKEPSLCNHDDFLNFCNAIHADEDDPELMFQDYEAFPREWWDESCFDEDNFESIKAYWDLCEKYSPDAVDAFIDWGCEELEHFKDCYVGEYDSEEEFPPIRSELLRGRTRIRRRVL